MRQAMDADHDGEEQKESQHTIYIQGSQLGRIDNSIDDRIEDEERTQDVCQNRRVEVHL